MNCTYYNQNCCVRNRNNGKCPENCQYCYPIDKEVKRHLLILNKQQIINYFSEDELFYEWLLFPEHKEIYHNICKEQLDNIMTTTSDIERINHDLKNFHEDVWNEYYDVMKEDDTLFNEFKDWAINEYVELHKDK